MSDITERVLFMYDNESEAEHFLNKWYTTVPEHASANINRMSQHEKRKAAAEIINRLADLAEMQLINDSQRSAYIFVIIVGSVYLALLERSLGIKDNHSMRRAMKTKFMNYINSEKSIVEAILMLVPNVYADSYTVGSITPILIEQTKMLHMNYLEHDYEYGPQERKLLQFLEEYVSFLTNDSYLPDYESDICHNIMVSPDGTIEIETEEAGNVNVFDIEEIIEYETKCPVNIFIL